MLRDLFYVSFGYLAGSILFAHVFGYLLGNKDVTEESRDHNPGTANAFVYGGFWCGVLTLCGDLAKGFFPVFLYLGGTPLSDCGFAVAFVLLAPVAGHILPLFHRFRGDVYKRQVRIFALLDRRLGKCRLLALEETIE